MTQFIKRVDENTSLPFKIIFPIMGAVVAATVWIQSTLAKIEAAQADAITRHEIIDWRNQLADQNKNLNVPYLLTK